MSDGALGSVELDLPPIVGAQPMDVVRRPRTAARSGSGFVKLLTELGCRAQLVPPEELELDPGRIVWITGSPIWHRRALRRLGSVPRDRRPMVVVWLNEPLPLPRDAAFRWFPPLSLAETVKVVLRDDRVTDPYSNGREVRRIVAQGLVDVLAVSTSSGCAFLAEHGVDTVFAPMGYTPGYGRDLGLERDRDVLFLGVPVPRRRRLIRRLRRRGVPVESVGHWSDRRYWGEQRTELLNRTKILLNFPRRPGLLSGMRMVLGMANGALVVAEPIYMPQPFEPGRHFIEAPLDELPAAVDRWLADDEGRRRITDEAYRFVTQEHRKERSIATILEAVASAQRRR